jgi:hypothetical protein
MSSPPKLRRKHKKRRHSLLEYAIVRLGGPLAISGLGISIMNQMFWIGVILFYVGAALFAVDVAHEDFFVRLPKSLKVTVGTAIVACVTVISWLWIFVPAPISLWVSANTSTYGTGTVFHGIRWRPEYSEMNMVFSNDSGTDYSDLDIQVSTDAVIVALTEIGGLGECRMSGIHGPVQPPNWQHWENDKPVGPANDPSWEYIVIPRDKNGRSIVPFSGGADWTYRIHCDKVPAKSKLSVFGATVRMNPAAYTGKLTPADSPFDKASSVSWVKIEGGVKTPSGMYHKTSIASCRVMTLCIL